MLYQDILKEPAIFLDRQQREFFQKQGYLFFQSLITPTQLNPLRNALKDMVEGSRVVSRSSNKVDLEEGHSAENPRLRRVTYGDEDYPSLWDFCCNSVVVDIAADLLGPNVRFRDVMLNFKWANGGSPVKWHQDFAFYPHTHTGTLQFLVFLEDVTHEMGPLRVIPGSHKGPIHSHYDEHQRWMGAIDNHDLVDSGLENAIDLVGNAGSVSVHHSCTIHGSKSNQSESGRPALVVTYSAADAIPYTAAPYPSANFGKIVRGEETRYAHHESLQVPMPPDWSAGYTSIFEHQGE